MNIVKRCFKNEIKTFKKKKRKKERKKIKNKIAFFNLTHVLNQNKNGHACLITVNVNVFNVNGIK